MKLEKAEIVSIILTLVFLAAAVLCLERQPGETVLAVQAVPEPTALEPLESSEKPININTASAQLLEQLPGVGEKLAERIVAYRAENGGFASAEDIMHVDGIGQGIFEEIKGLITVN